MISRNLVTNQVQVGDRISVNYHDKSFDVIVIDPNGLGEGQPSVGFGFRMMEKYAGIPQPTLSCWVIEKEGLTLLKLPSDKAFRVIDILGNDNNYYKVVEATDWFDLCFDLIENPGRTSKNLKTKLLAFIRWFTIKGFYAEAYTALKGVYTDKDSRATTRWLNSRQSGKLVRKQYTDLLQSQGCRDYDYAMWTDIVYEGLFGKNARQMKRIWECVDGNRMIARNYIPESTGLEAVQFCENLVVQNFVDDLEEAHSIAIRLAQKKYKLDFVS
jgi:hypothetical protein